MKVIFFGTPPFAASILESLIGAGIEVCAVVSRPDRSKGRSGTPVPTPVKEFLLQNAPSLPIYQPEKCSTPEFAEQLREHRADLFVVVAYGEIIKQDILDIPRLGCINIHASLLPKLRGAAPIQRAIIDGEKKTGITIMHMVRKMDAGDMIAKVEVAIGPETTFGELEKELMEVSAPLLLEVIQQIEKGVAQREPQDESLVTFAPKIELEDCEIDWNQPAEKIHDLIRGVNPYPGAWTTVEVKGEAKRMKVFRSRIASEPMGMDLPAGTFHKEKKSLFVVCGKGTLEILEVQVEGKKRMTSAELLLGINLTGHSKN